ncbi:MAG: hypothetical protein ACLPR9_04505 [Acidimicrobiales bacterium]|jgi:hypothetical protein
MVNHPTPCRRPEKVSVSWRLPVGVGSILLYFVQQLRAYPHNSAVAEDALRQALAQRKSEVER